MNKNKNININNKNNVNNIKNKLFKFFLILITVMIFLNKSILAIENTSFADGSKDITAIIITVCVSLAVALIFLAIAIIVKINSLKKAADIINEYIRTYGMPKPKDKYYE